MVMPYSALSPYTPETVAIGFVHGLLSGLPGGASHAAGALEQAGIPEELLQYRVARVTAAARAYAARK